MELSNKFCSCGRKIEQARLDAAKGKAKTCIKCMNSKDVERVAGFRIISGKNTYTEMQIVSQSAFKQLTGLQERKGQSPSKGVKVRVEAKTLSSQL